jgi:hypothetical protein
MNQTEFVLENYGAMSRSEILKKTNISIRQYYKILSGAGIERRRSWTNEEIQFVVKNYEIMTKQDIADHLGRTIHSVKNLGHKIGITKDVETRSAESCQSKTLCWKCAKATDYRKCSWVAPNFKSVQGWVAEQSVLYAGQPSETISYCVKECPNFERDRRC